MKENLEERLRDLPPFEPDAALPPNGRVRDPIQTDADLWAATDKWQARLRLRDWHIVARFGHGIDTDEAYGQITKNDKKRVALATIKHPDDWDSFTAHDLDQESVERTLVHELLHIWIDYDDPATTFGEQAINALSAALVEAYR